MAITVCNASGSCCLERESAVDMVPSWLVPSRQHMQHGILCTTIRMFSTSVLYRSLKHAKAAYKAMAQPCMDLSNFMFGLDRLLAAPIALVVGLVHLSLHLNFRLKSRGLHS